MEPKESSRPANIRIYGEKGGLHWRQMEPNTLIHRVQDQGTRLIRTGVGELSEATQQATRIPAGHPEGYLEAFANIYRNFARALRSRLKGSSPSHLDLDFPTVQDGLRGMAFIEAVVNASQSDQKWYSL